MSRLLLLVCLFALAVSGCTGAAADECDERIGGVRAGVCIPPPTQRPAAPDASAPVLGEDRELSLADLRGDVVVMNFWGSWCGPCRAEQPDLNQAHAALSGEDVTFLGVNVDDTEGNATAHEREFAIPYASLFDPAYAYAARFEGIGPRAIPSTIIIDRQGRVAARLFGAIRGPEEVLALVERLIGEPADG